MIVSPNTATSEVTPLKPGQIPLGNAISVRSGSSLKIPAKNLDAVTEVFVGNQSVAFESKNGNLSVQMPEKLEL